MALAAAGSKLRFGFASLACPRYAISDGWFAASTLSWLRIQKCAFSVGWRKRIYLSYCMFLTIIF